MKINNKLIYSFLVTTCLVLFALSLNFRVRIVDLEHKLSVSNKEVSVAKAEYDSKKLALGKEYYRYASENGTQFTQIVGIQGSDTQQLSKIANDFFEIYYDYNNSKSYNDRKGKLAEFADQNVLDDAALFSSDPKLIDTLGVRSTFNSCNAFYNSSDSNEIQGTVSVNYTFGYSDSDKKEGTQVYAITYNKVNDKITNIKKFN